MLTCAVAKVATLPLKSVAFTMIVWLPFVIFVASSEYWKPTFAGASGKTVPTPGSAMPYVALPISLPSMNTSTLEIPASDHTQPWSNTPVPCNGLVCGASKYPNGVNELGPVSCLCNSLIAARLSFSEPARIYVLNSNTEPGSQLYGHVGVNCIVDPALNPLLSGYCPGVNRAIPVFVSST